MGITLLSVNKNIEKLEEKKHSFLKKKNEIDNKQAPIRQYLVAVKGRARLGQYDNAKRFNKARKTSSSLGRESQLLQFEITEINQKLKKLYREQSELDEGVNNKKIIAYDTRMASYEAFFIESAKKYLSGNEFEIISRMATNMMSIRDK